MNGNGERLRSFWAEMETGMVDVRWLRMVFIGELNDGVSEVALVKFCRDFFFFERIL